jgi:molecular chaperone GrpE
MAREETEVAPEIVLEEFEKGYKYKNHVLRHAKVVVSK